MRDLVDYGLLGNFSVEVPDLETYYQEQFTHAAPDSLKVENGQGYLVRSGLPERLSEINPNVSIVMTVCDPVNRLWRDWIELQQKVQLEEFDEEESKWESRHAFDTLVDTITDIQSTHPKVYNLRDLQVDTPGFFSTRVALGFYYNHLKNWLKHLPLHQIHIVNGENLFNEPWIELARLQKFLAVKPMLKKSHFHRDSNHSEYCFQSKSCTKNGEWSILDSSDQISSNSAHKLGRIYREPNEQLMKLTGLELFGREML